MGIVFYDKVFEGGISGSTGTVYSLPQYDAALARAVRWYVTARCTQVTGTTPAISLNLAHSATGMPSEFKNISNAAKVPVANGALALNTINIVEGSVRYTDANVAVPAGFVRLEISLVGADNNANVEVWVTGRDDT